MKHKLNKKNSLSENIKQINLPDEYIVEPIYNVIELRIYYMRDYDKKSYQRRTFYFYKNENDFGMWTNINQAKESEDHLVSKMREESLKIPANLYNERIEEMLNDSLYEF